MAVSEAIKNQFIEFIKLQGFDDQYIDRQEEKRIIEVGVKNGLSVDESLVLIREIAAEKGLVVERDAEEQAQALLKQAAANDGKIDKKEFEQALEHFQKMTQGKVPEHKAKLRLKSMMEEQDWKAKEGGLFGSKWYSAIS